MSFITHNFPAAVVSLSVVICHSVRISLIVELGTTHLRLLIVLHPPTAGLLSTATDDDAWPSSNVVVVCTNHRPFAKFDRGQKIFT